MLIYYLCSKECNYDNNSFEYKLAKSLLKKDFQLWSTSIPLMFGDSENITDIDDRFGNTSIAIIVISHNSLDDEYVNYIKTVQKYKTIKIIFILNKITEDVLRNSDINYLKELANNFDNYTVIKSTRGLNNISSDIGIIISGQAKKNDRISTGIKALDYLLGGGLSLGGSFNITGPSGSGKTSIGVQIQKHILETGGCGLYITYSEAPIKILKRFEDMGCNITKYIADGSFKIFDSYSALNNLSAEDTAYSVGESWAPAIIHLDNPYDSVSYFEKQIAALKELGGGCVNIIDNVNIRYEISKEQQNDDKQTYKQYFTRFKAMAGDILHNIGVHLVDADYDDELIKHLIRAEDGTINLKCEIDQKTGETTRKLRIDERGNIGCGDHHWYEYTISKQGIKIFRPDFD